uniref:Myb/SANT-like domain-containing protein n=1 Tax=Oryza punctata TaxID=4537 RepID=A0A0E0L0U6_ORYPU
MGLIIFTTGLLPPPATSAASTADEGEEAEARAGAVRDPIRSSPWSTPLDTPPTVCRCVWARKLESGEDSCDSYTSDTGNAKVAEDNVLHTAQALTKVCAKSPEAVIEFVHRVSPVTIVRSLSWDIVCNGDSTKMSVPRTRWTDLEMRVFLASCLEEIQAYTITSNTPKAQAYDNLAKKMYDK